MQKINIKMLFLIDGLGAFLTALLLFCLLRPLHLYFGMPQSTLTTLSIIAFILGCYSITCFFFVTHYWKLFLRAITVANIMYCVATASLIGYYYQQLTIPGLIYFIVEILIISILLFLELHFLKNHAS
jgi:hypothetical protein